MLNKKALAITLSVATLLGSATVYFGYYNYHTNKELNNMKEQLKIELKENEDLSKLGSMV